MPGDYYEVNIYYLLNNNNVDSLLKLTFKHTDSSPGWKTFDVTPIVESWKQGWINWPESYTDQRRTTTIMLRCLLSGEQEDMLNTEPLLHSCVHS